MAKPSDPHEDLKKFLRQLGIDPASVTVVMPKEPLGGAERPANDNVIPFPKSSNPRGFGRRQPSTVSPLDGSKNVRELLMRAIKLVDSGEFNAQGAVVLMTEKEGGGFIDSSFVGLNLYEAVGVMEDAKHDMIAGGFEKVDPEDGAA